MKNKNNLLTWILGGLSAAAAAAVITIASPSKTVPTSSPPASAVTAQVTLAPVSPPLPAPATSTSVATAATAAPVAAVLPVTASVAPEPAPQTSAQSQATAEPPAQSGQIWECTTNGLKTFSNNPCGEKSTLIEVRPINTMNATPSPRYARTYDPEAHSVPAYAEQNSYPDQDTYAQQGAPEPVISYGAVRGYAFRRSPEHTHRPPYQHDRKLDHHHPGPTMRRF